MYEEIINKTVRGLYKSFIEISWGIFELSTLSDGGDAVSATLGVLIDAVHEALVKGGTVDEAVREFLEAYDGATDTQHDA